jgi:hypothetical protein
MSAAIAGRNPRLPQSREQGGSTGNCQTRRSALPSHPRRARSAPLAPAMLSLKLQKRLAASVLECGRNKVWLDPNEINEISMANSSTWWLRASCGPRPRFARARSRPRSRTPDR